MHINNDEERRFAAEKLRYNQKQMNETHFRNGSYFLIIFLLFLVILFLTDGLIRLLLLLIIFFVFVYRAILAFRNTENETVLQKENRKIKQSIAEYDEKQRLKRLEKQNPIYQKEKTVYQKEMKVVGVSQYRDNINKVMSNIAKHGAYEPYYGLTNREIEESGEKVFKYEPITINKIKIVPEPDNPHDPNALQVIADDNLIGYIEKDIAAEINDYLTRPGYTIKSTLKVVGGPYKYYDYVQSKMVTNTELTIGFRVNLTIISNY